MISFFGKQALYLIGFWATFIAALALSFLISKPFEWQQVQLNACFSVLLSIIFVVFTHWFIKKIDRFTWPELGIAPFKKGILFLVLGFVAATVFLAIQAIVSVGLGWFHIVPAASPSSGELGSLSFALLLLFGTVASGVGEEIAFRGYIFSKYRQRYGVWLSAVVSSVLFAVVVHFNKLSVDYLIALITLGLLLVFLRLTTKSLWFCIGFHWSFNWTQSVLWGTGGRALVRIEPVGQFSAWSGVSLSYDFLISTLMAGLLALILIVVYQVKKRM